MYRKGEGRIGTGGVKPILELKIIARQLLAGS